MRRRIISSKIGIQLVFALAVSFLVSILWLIVISRSVMSFYFSIKGINSPLGFNIINLTVFATEMGVFVLVFLMLVNRKVKYIKYSSLMVKDIADGNLGATIRIKGQDELAELGKSINAMSKELKKKFENERQMEKAKNELITNVSHDLRTPLTSIIGYVDLLKRKEYKSEEEFGEYIDIISSKAQGLEKLLNELFEYTKLTTPGVNINKKEIDLGGLLGQLTGEYIPIFGKEGLTLKKDIPEQDIMVSIDIEKMVRVFDNILINAKNYSLKPSDIWVKLCKQNKLAVISISNQTDQPPVENLDMLFEKLYRGDASRTENDGSGLGLAIAKKIVELHGGKIWAEYKEGFLIFYIELITTAE